MPLIRVVLYIPLLFSANLGDRFVMANIPAAVIGDKLAGNLPAKAIRRVAAGVFAVLGILTLSGARL